MFLSRKPETESSQLPLPSMFHVRRGGRGNIARRAQARQIDWRRGSHQTAIIFTLTLILKIDWQLCHDMRRSIRNSGFVTVQKRSGRKKETKRRSWRPNDRRTSNSTHTRAACDGEQISRRQAHMHRWRREARNSSIIPTAVSQRRANRS